MICDVFAAAGVSNSICKLDQQMPATGAEARGCSSVLPKSNKPLKYNVVTVTAVSAGSVSAASDAAQQLGAAYIRSPQGNAHLSILATYAKPADAKDQKGGEPTCKFCRSGVCGKASRGDRLNLVGSYVRPISTWQHDRHKGHWTSRAGPNRPSQWPQHARSWDPSRQRWDEAAP